MVAPFDSWSTSVTFEATRGTMQGVALECLSKKRAFSESDDSDLTVHRLYRGPSSLLVDRFTSHDFSHASCTCDHTHIVAQGVSGARSFHPHAIHDVTCVSVRCLSPFCLLSLYLSLLPFLSSLSSCSLSCTTSPMSSPPRVKTTALTHNEEYCPVAIYNPLTSNRL